MKQGLDPWVEGYLDYLLEVRRLTVGSVRDMRCGLKNACVFMAEHAPGKALWQVELEDYIAWINHEREQDRSELTISKNISHVRGFLDYSWRSGRSTRNVLDGFSLMDSKRSRRPVPRVLSLEEARRLVDACLSRTFVERRDRMIVLILYGCGLRNRELCQLDVQDIGIERREIFVRNGKNSKQRYVPVPSALWTELLAYLAERGGKRGPLFKTHHKKKRVNTRYVSDIVREAARRADISGEITPKVLRHSFGSHLAEQGIDIAVISTLMGHRSPKETTVYLHVMEGNKEAAVNKLMPEGGAK